MRNVVIERFNIPVPLHVAAAAALASVQVVFYVFFCFCFLKALNSRNFNPINYLQTDELVCGTGMGTITPGLETQPQVCFFLFLLY